MKSKSLDKMSVVDCFISLLYPRRCAICGEVIDLHKLVCDGCKDLPVRLVGRCCDCGLILEKCSCRAGERLFDDLASAFVYKENISNGFHRFKFGTERYRAEYFARAAAEAYVAGLSDIKFDGMCFVPGSHAKRENGGIVPAEYLAEIISKKIGVPIIKNCMSKIKKNEPQHKQLKEFRRDNVRGVYRANVDLSGKTILLFDDIKTTGATLDECAKELKLAGAEYVYALTVFSRVRNEK